MTIKKNVQYTVQYEKAAPQRKRTDPRPEGKSAQMRNDKNDGGPGLGHTILSVGAEGRRPYAMYNAT
jgi:hypothetical protein